MPGLEGEITCDDNLEDVIALDVEDGGFRLLEEMDLLSGLRIRSMGTKESKDWAAL